MSRVVRDPFASYLKDNLFSPGASAPADASTLDRNPSDVRRPGRASSTVDGSASQGTLPDPRLDGRPHQAAVAPDLDRTPGGGARTDGPSGPSSSPAPTRALELDGALLFVVDAGGQRYGGYALSGDVPLRPALARTLSRVVECLFEGQG